MLTITPSALEHLSDALGKIDEPKPDDVCFRLVPGEKNTLTLTVDSPSPDDTEYEHDGKAVLVLSDDIRSRGDGRTLDADGSGHLVLT